MARTESSRDLRQRLHKDSFSACVKHQQLLINSASTKSKYWAKKFGKESAWQESKFAAFHGDAMS